jgi:hypothetical protein
VRAWPVKFLSHALTAKNFDLSIATLAGADGV